ncbi:MAG: archease [Alphaproteobacteria bacterium]|nr:MAG: archease [Alphaproteobacteria bacterium]
MVDYEPVGPQSHRRSMILADSVEELLVNWYNEFIFLLEQGQVVTDARIRTCSDTKLDAELQCAPVLPGRPLREVKAATWHQLEVNGTEGNWRARIYLDL